MKPQLSGLALALFLVVLPAGCRILIPPVWVEDDLSSRNEDVLWQYALSAMSNNGFPVGAGANPATREIVSGWKVDLQPFRGDGYRARATMAFDRGEDGRFTVRARVMREFNQDIVRPLDPTFAKWEQGEDDEAMAQRLVQFILSRTGQEFELGDEDPSRPTFSR